MCEEKDKYIAKVPREGNYKSSSDSWHSILRWLRRIEYEV